MSSLRRPLCRPLALSHGFRKPAPTACPTKAQQLPKERDAREQDLSKDSISLLFRPSRPGWQAGAQADSCGHPGRRLFWISGRFEEILRMNLSAPVRLLLASVVLAAITPHQAASAQGAAVALASHRAVYDLKLASTRGKRAMSAVRGRILYDFSGSACEGYALQFRQVSELDSGEGKSLISDLRATSWEDGAAKRLRFHSQNYFDENLRESVDGQAEREAGGIAVELTEPGTKKLNLKTDLVFPAEHIRRIIDAARDGKTLLQVSVYDGSDTGEKLYD